MGLACSQIMLLSLTARKADCEYGISIDSAHKMALTREMSELSSEYFSKLKSKQYSYYANGQYNKLNYKYLMGDGTLYQNLTSGNTSNMKDRYDMVLTDYKGQVVLSSNYANAITAVLGTSALGKNGKGGTFSINEIPKMIFKATGVGSADDYKSIIDNRPSGNYTYKHNEVNTLTGQSNGNSGTTDASDNYNSLLSKILDYYYPIFLAAASNGWTTEYNNSINENEDYINDALVTGSFQLALVNSDGQYTEDTSMTYFVTSGLIDTNAGAEAREEVTAWYNAEKARITEKENYLDIHMSDLSTELEAINTEIQSIQSFIDDAISSVFDWGSS